ncbi:cell wall metabolism sensor histidine kinase WalK [Candidatus Cyanaurora vandensis]|uniref:sensor histidine kinase n=1 Tax=Candidatus Cyanaurora vandensis TaxID=2714958 RepID=UPI00257F3E7B|nr:HAMP domain-containing sensor histidine kinase [Candidatus Cyanaurora vandensis]
MKRLRELCQTLFHSAIRWCLKHQTTATVLVLLAVVLPMGVLNLLEYRSMANYERDSIQTTENQLKYILSRLVLQSYDDFEKLGSFFHLQDQEHTQLLKGKATAAPLLAGSIQQVLEQQRAQKPKAKRHPLPHSFVILPELEWSVFFAPKTPTARLAGPITRARNYFRNLTPADRDVGYLFFYDPTSELLILLHPVSSQKIYQAEEMVPPRAIEAVMGLALDKSFLEKDYFNTLIRRGQTSRFEAKPITAVLTKVDYHFRVLDEQGKIIFTDTQDWDSLAKKSNYIRTELILKPEEKFLTGWKFEVMTKSNLSQITAYSFWQMFWASGAVAILLGLLLVITLKAGMAAVKVSDMKADIVAGVSHDLKTPLAGIIASAQLLASGRASGAEETRQFSGYIVTEAKRLTEVVEKVLTVAKLESHQLKMKPTAITVPELVDQAIKSISCAFPHAIILKGGIPQGEVQGDFQALTTVLVNLMDNAIRYSDKEEPWVKVQAFLSQHGEKCTLHLQVEDRGVGIPRDEQPFIFQKFYRVRNGLVTDTDGTGLGLAIAAQIVQAHRGQIQVESEVGVGSKFIVRLPYERSNSSC